MKRHVFLGPSMPLGAAQGLLPDAAFHPPAAMGDIYRIASEPDCRLIALIDGVFGQVPAVWHKEILFALERGIRVLGAASMGALRACELHAFGMEGVGCVFEWFASGTLEDDDEVALAHGPATLGYPALSVPMVNVRRTLQNATIDGLISPQVAKLVAEAAKAIHFIDRSWMQVGEAAVAAGVESRVVDRLLAVAHERRHDVKRDDAVALLRKVAAQRESGPRAGVRVALERTVFWHRLVSAASGGCAEEGDDAVGANELRRHAMLACPDGPALMDRAQLAVLAARESTRRGAAPTTEALQAAVDEYRRDQGLLSKTSLDGWLERRELTRNDFAGIAWRAKVIRETVDGEDGALDEAFKVELQRTGRFGALRRQALEKRRFLLSRSIGAPTLADCGLDEREFHRWCRGRLGLGDGQPLDRCAPVLGFRSPGELLTEALSQYLWEMGGRHASELEEGG